MKHFHGVVAIVWLLLAAHAVADGRDVAVALGLLILSNLSFLQQKVETIEERLPPP